MLAGHHDDVDSGSEGWLWRLGLVVVGSTREDKTKHALPRGDVHLDIADRRQENSVGDGRWLLRREALPLGRDAA